MNPEIQEVLDGSRDWCIVQGGCTEILREMPDGCVQTCVTSPPYWGLRDYGVEGQLGLEKTPEEYIEKMVAVFREVKRVLRNNGTLWLNLGDTYSAQRWTSDSPQKMNKMKDIHRGIAPIKLSGLPEKNLVGVPWRVAFALQSDGWYLRSDIIWHKPNPMPESVTDRPTKSHEYVFLLTKAARYYYDADAVREPHIQPERGVLKKNESCNPHNRLGKLQGIAWVPKTREYHPDGRNLRSVWTIPTHSFSEVHFATFPTKLVEPCVLAGSHEGDIILDPFGGAGTVNMVALRLNRRCISIELNPAYVALAKRRIASETANLPM